MRPRPRAADSDRRSGSARLAPQLRAAVSIPKPLQPLAVGLGRKVGCLLLAGLLVPALARAEIRDGFEQEPVRWKLGASDCPVVRLVDKAVDPQERHAGQSAARVRLFGQGGTYAYLTYKIDRTHLIDEVSPRLWVKSDRPGLRLLVRVVLPKSIDPRTRQPVTTVLYGDSYSKLGSWQALEVTNLRKKFLRAIPQLRSRLGAWVSGRNAYVDCILLNAYGGSGLTTVWTDDLSYQVFPWSPQIDPQVRPAQNLAPQPAASSAEVGVKVHGDIVSADGRPLMVRAIEHNGESLTFLKSLGFNAVVLAGAPTADQLVEAGRLKLWLIAPPPEGRITPEHSMVLAWRLGEGLGPGVRKAVRQMAVEVRRRDLLRRRPVMCGPLSHFADYRHVADILLIESPTPAGAWELGELGRWWRTVPDQARLTGPVWTAIPTEPQWRLEQQLAGFDANSAGEWAYIEPDQLRALCYHAVAAGHRGLFFRSRTPLDRRHEIAELRRKSLELINRELALISPWAAGGLGEGDLSVASADVRVSVLRTELSQLLMVTRTARDDQYVSAPRKPQELPLISSSLSRSGDAYRLTFAGVRTERMRRVPGGFQLVLNDRELCSLVILSQNAAAMQRLSQRLRTEGPRIAQLRYETTRLHAQRTTAILERLIAIGGALPPARGAVADVQRLLEQCRKSVQRQDLSTAIELSNVAMNALSTLRRRHWRNAVKSFPSPASSPLCADFSLLPEHYSLARRARGLRWGPNTLPHGDFENLRQMQKVGWSRSSNNVSDGTPLARVELSLERPWSGRHALHLISRPVAEEAAAVVAQPSVRISSAPVRLRSGQLARIHGWVNIPEALKGDPRGLRISDSLAGSGLGQFVRRTQGWQEFSFYRAAAEDDYLLIHFDLFGLGEVFVDEVTIAVATPPPSQAPLPTPGRAPLGGPPAGSAGPPAGPPAEPGGAAAADSQPSSPRLRLRPGPPTPPKSPGNDRPSSGPTDGAAPPLLRPSPAGPP